MSTTVLAPSGLEISANTDTGESAESMLETLSGKKSEKTPRVLVDKGQKVDDDGTEKDETSRAASTLGKKGGEAAAKARKLEAKGKPADEKPDAKEAKPGDDKAKDAKPAEKTEDEKEAEAKAKKGNPRHDPEARIGVLAREKREAQDRADRAEAELERVRKAPAARTEAPPAREARTADPAAREAQGDPRDPKPKLDDYDGEGAYEKFVEDVSRWSARDEHRKVEHRQREEHGRREVVQTITTHVDKFHERLTGLPKGDAGQEAAFGDFMASLPDELQSPTSFQLADYAARTNQPHIRSGPKNLIADLIVKSDKPREIFEYFADNLGEHQRIAALGDPYAIAGEMAILSNRLDAVTADTSSGREVSRAGSPGRSVPGSPRAAEPNLSGELDFDEHQRRKRAAQK